MYRKFIYDNGLRVVIKPQQETAAVTVLVMVKVGSRYEKKQQAGIAHFTEHLMFKGTKKRPNTLAISKELDGVGADYNAFTSKEYTGYYIKVSAEHIVMAIDMLSDMLLNSKFDSQEIEKERGVILEEIRMYEDAPMMMVDEVFDSLAYEKNSLARDVAGTVKTVSKMQRKDFLQFVNKYYVPNNMLISVAGKVNVDEVFDLIKNKFKVNNKKNKKITNYKKFIIKQKNAQVFIKQKKTEQIHLALGFVNKINHLAKEKLPLQVAALAFGGNMSSRLFINIRERHGLCYYIRSKVNSFSDVGDFTIYAGIDKNRLAKAIELIIKELQKVKQKGISLTEFNKAKQYIKGKLILSLEDSSHQAQWYADKWLFGKKIQTPEELIKKLDDLQLTEVNKIIKKIIDKKYLNLALIGEYQNEKKLLTLLKKLK